MTRIIAGNVRFWLLAAFLGTPMLIAQAQSRSDGSVYGGFGIGERESVYTSQAQGMGVLGVGLFTPGYLNVANPGAFSDQVLTRFAGGLDFNGVRSTDAADQTSTASGGNVGALQFGFPIVRRKLGIAASFGSYTNAGYRATTGGLLPAEDGEPATAYQTNYEGDGGLQEFTFGVGFRPVETFSFGVAVSALWGIVEDAVRVEYDNSADFVGSSNQRVSTRLSGFTGSVGLVARAPRLFGERDVLTAGASLVLPASLDGARTQFVNQGLVLSDTVGTSIGAEVTVPLRVLGGFTYAPGSHWLFVADGYFEPWTSFDSNLAFRGFRPGQPATFHDAFRAGIGAQFIPAGGDVFASKLARTALRFGLFVERDYAAPVENYSLVTYGVAGGFSLPTAIPGTYLDISTQIGTRGESEGILVKDLLYRISVTLNFGERWFVQRRLR